MDTGSHLVTSEPAFHADDAQHVADYRTVSALAIVSLMFGLASPLCIAWPLFMAIPLFGAALSIIAIRRIDGSDGALVGRWAATTGLMLCVFSGTAAVTHDLAMQSIRTRQAESFAREWIELLLAGNTEQAFLLTVPANSPPPPERPGMPAPTQTPQEQFLERPLTSALAAAGADADVQLADTLAYEPQSRGHYMIQQEFHVIPHGDAGSARHPIEFLLTLQRSRLGGERRMRWLVSNYALQATADATRVH